MPEKRGIEIPDWLADMQPPTRDESPELRMIEEPAGEADEAGIPDWLAELTSSP